MVGQSALQLLAGTLLFVGASCLLGDSDLGEPPTLDDLRGALEQSTSVGEAFARLRLLERNSRRAPSGAYAAPAVRQVISGAAVTRGELALLQTGEPREYAPEEGWADANSACAGASRVQKIQLMILQR